MESLAVIRAPFGISTTSPAGTLDVGTGSICLGGTCNVAWPSVATQSEWGTIGSNIYNINAGNVGVGTTVPAQKLSVVGTIQSTSGGFQYPDGTTQATAGFYSMTAFNSTGTFTTPANSTTSTIYKYQVVGGGGGGGGDSGSTYGGGGGAGGAGGCAIGSFTGVAPSTAIVITIGGAGTAGSSAGGNGGAGSASTIGSPLAVSAGGGGGGSGNTTGYAVSGGSGGTTSGATINMPGGTGGLGALSYYVVGAVVYGSGGGGGASCLGGGGSGGLYKGSYTAAGAGQAPGSGGGGGGYNSGGAAGAAGAAGIAIIERVSP